VGNGLRHGRGRRGGTARHVGALAGDRAPACLVVVVVMLGGVLAVGRIRISKGGVQRRQGPALTYCRSRCRSSRSVRWNVFPQPGQSQWRAESLWFCWCLLDRQSASLGLGSRRQQCRSGDQPQMLGPSVRLQTEDGQLGTQSAESSNRPRPRASGNNWGCCLVHDSDGEAGIDIPFRSSRRDGP